MSEKKRKLEDEIEQPSKKSRVGSSFKLDDKFVENYTDFNPFKNNPLGLIVFLRTYSRKKENGTKETFVDVTRRAVEFCFSVQKDHITLNKLGWDEQKAKLSAEEMFIRILETKFCPAGRVLWACNTAITNEKHLNEAMFNCGFVSTKDVATEKAKPFSLLMNDLMVGIGFSCDLRGANTIYIKGPIVTETETYIVDDSREGWVKALDKLLSSYFDSNPTMKFDYSQIRLAGTPLKTFGGTSSGYKCLEDMLENIRKVMDRNKGFMISGRTIADIVNLIAVCVVSGNIRRSSTLLLGNETEEFLNLKNYDINPERKDYGWSSNNSVLANVGQDYTNIAKHIAKCRGEPGVIWLDNIRNYSRMCEQPDYKDTNVMGVNPCVTKDMWIMTKEGEIQVKDLIGKKFIAIVDGKEYESNEFFETGIKSVYRVQLEDGAFYKATGNHQVLTINEEGKEKWKNTDQLKIGDILALNDKNKYSCVFSIILLPKKERVYDCVVKGIHMFVCNGIKVHNCSEIGLDNGELCNLINVFPNNCKDLDDFKRTLKYAYLYGKINTLLPSNCELTNRESLKNRRMGISLSGIQQFISSHSLDILKQWCVEGYSTIKKYDEIYSNWLAVRQSIKLTSEKPDGNTSCVFGTTSGIHFPESRFIIRRVTISKNSSLIPIIAEAGYKIEDSVYDKYSVIVEVPYDYGEGVRGLEDVSMWEQLKIQEFMQRYWCDNLVSSTVTYKKEEEKDISSALEYFQYTLKSVSFLPRIDQGAYKQMPLEKISEEKYRELIKNIKPLAKLDALFTHSEEKDAETEKFCTGDTCLLKKDEKK